MRLGLDSYSYYMHLGFYSYKRTAPMPLPTFLKVTKNLGLAGAQIGELGPLSEVPSGYIEQIADTAKRLGLYLEFATGGVEPAKLVERLDIARRLGATILRTSLRCDRYSRIVPLNLQLRQAVSNLSQVVDVAKRYNIAIALENHQDVTAPELGSVITGVNSEYVRICLDTANSLAVLEDPIATAETLAPYTISMHLKDAKISVAPFGTKIGHVCLGSGFLDLPRIMEIVRRRAPDPNVNIEVVSEPVESEGESLKIEADCVARSVDYARRVLGF